MASYKATRNYRSNHNGRHFAYDKGTTVDVDPDVAEWVNRDSPGTLKRVGGRKKAAGTAEQDQEPQQSAGGNDDG